jgi:DNA modification methylase
MGLMSQLLLPFNLPEPERIELSGPYRERVAALLAQNLDFHDQDSGYASHNFHAFPAKFPPQLPRTFIRGLTHPGDIVLDPMMGSGTTVVEALLAGRLGIGCDIDPLALQLCKVKVTRVAVDRVVQAGSQVLERAAYVVQKQSGGLAEALNKRFDPKTRAFIDYWFRPETQLELLALIAEIEQIEDTSSRAFLELAFSAIIITKSGGVSLARDLAHTRPHRVNDKIPRSALVEFKKRFQQNLNSLAEFSWAEGRVDIHYSNAQALPLAEASVDLIVTSPPYAANAIDYMRAHKFSLVWLGHPIDTLAQKRKEYIGGEAVNAVAFEALPAKTAHAVSIIDARDAKKGLVLHRYYSEMARSLREMFRVLKPGKAALVVVGTSTMRGLDTRTQDCLADIGEAIGFEVVDIATRRLDRDRRMMPARRSRHPSSQIEERMHEEYVIGFYKPPRDRGKLSFTHSTDTHIPTRFQSTPQFLHHLQYPHHAPRQRDYAPDWWDQLVAPVDG